MQNITLYLKIISNSRSMTSHWDYEIIYWTVFTFHRANRVFRLEILCDVLSPTCVHAINFIRWSLTMIPTLTRTHAHAHAHTHTHTTVKVKKRRENRFTLLLNLLFQFVIGRRLRNRWDSVAKWTTADLVTADCKQFEWFVTSQQRFLLSFQMRPGLPINWLLSCYFILLDDGSSLWHITKNIRDRRK
jgi:hypothetical protein